MFVLFFGMYGKKGPIAILWYQITYLRRSFFKFTGENSLHDKPKISQGMN